MHPNIDVGCDTKGGGLSARYDEQQPRGREAEIRKATRTSSEPASRQYRHTYALTPDAAKPYIPSKPRRGPLYPRPGGRQEPLRGKNVLTNSASWNAQIGPIRRTSAARSNPRISATRAQGKGSIGVVELFEEGDLQARGGFQPRIERPPRGLGRRGE